MMHRAVQLSLDPDIIPDRPIGTILGSVIAGTNSDLIAAVAPLYLSGSVLDVTYGLGGWWRRFRPDPFVAHDLNPAKGDGVDFRALPEEDASFDAVCFDPPYIAQGGTDSNVGGLDTFRDRFGLTSRTGVDVKRDFVTGLAECSRVSRRWVLVKCFDYVDGAGLILGHVHVLTVAETLGLRCHDLYVHHGGPGPGGHQTLTVKRARRHHSYLLVFEVRRR